MELQARPKCDTELHCSKEMYCSEASSAMWSTTALHVVVLTAY